MNFEEIQTKLQAALPAAVLGVEEHKPDRAFKINPENIIEVVRYLQDELGFETLGDLCGVDYPALPAYCVVYHLQSYTHKMVVRLKCYLPRQDQARIPSLTPLFKAANWFEREAFDMLGIRFTGHPDLRRILCPEDWVGHPLRKDYSTPDYYQGMPVPLYFEDLSPTPSGESHS